MSYVDMLAVTLVRSAAARPCPLALLSCPDCTLLPSAPRGHSFSLFGPAAWGPPARLYCGFFKQSSLDGGGFCQPALVRMLSALPCPKCGRSTLAAGRAGA